MLENYHQTHKATTNEVKLIGNLYNKNCFLTILFQLHNSLKTHLILIKQSEQYH